MPLLIDHIESGSLAAEAGINSGDEIISINGYPIRDFLDLEMIWSDYRLDILLKTPEGKNRKVQIFREYDKALGISPQAYRHKNCKNNCIFCFIDQMPRKMRSSLYVKDDDYVFSFVYGNYITLTNLSPADYKRIYAQQISPLYISLHSTDKELRQKMMRSWHPVDPMRVLKRLADHDIEYHLQIVCVPGYNDGEALRKSISDVLKSKLPALSLGIVPVGLTRYRDGLCQLQAFDSKLADLTLQSIYELREKYHSDIVYPADELYVLAGWEIPSSDFYGDYPQLENGIGMLRLTWENYQRHKRAFLKILRGIPGKRFRMFCSRSAHSLIQNIAQDLNRLLKAELVGVQVIRNDFLGEHVSVAGLITYQDIAQQAQLQDDEIALLPSGLLNNEGLTLDGFVLKDISEFFGGCLLMIDPLFESWYWVD